VKSRTTIHDRRIDPERSIKVVIAGEGPERDALELQARMLTTPGAVRFIGQRSDKAELFAMADVLVLPSHQEGLGVSALEAMAAGKAVVASRVGGLAEAVVEDRTGLFAEPGDVDGFAIALERLAGDRSLCRRLGAAGPGRVAEGFLAHQMVEGYVVLYESLRGAPRDSS
jgi:glycosyltransferase involved in cell wall biosynthesis